MNVNERIYRNVKALAGINGKDMKDIESKIGRSTGYLSRKKSRFSVEDMMALCDIFGIQPYELMECDYEYELRKKIAIEEMEKAVMSAGEFYCYEQMTKYLDAVAKKATEGKSSE